MAARLTTDIETVSSQGALRIKARRTPSSSTEHAGPTDAGRRL